MILKWSDRMEATVKRGVAWFNFPPFCIMHHVVTCFSHETITYACPFPSFNL